MTSAQIGAARGLLDWTVGDLAERAGVPRNTLSNIGPVRMLAPRDAGSDPPSPGTGGR